MFVYEGQLVDHHNKYGIVVSRFNHFITEKLLEGAIDCLKRHGVHDDNIVVVWVPGAFEIPQAAKQLLSKKMVNAIICLGAVIRGGTTHFEHVSTECIKGVSAVGLKSDIPVSLGILTTESIEQAIERAGTKAGNKGAEAALHCIEMVSLFESMNHTDGE